MPPARTRSSTACASAHSPAIATSGIERGLEMHVTSAAHLANLAHQERFAGRIDEILRGVAGRRIGLLGLAFKAGTDDIRSSPAVRLAGWLLEHGADVHADDPAAAGHASRALPTLGPVHLYGARFLQRRVRLTDSVAHPRSPRHPLP